MKRERMNETEIALHQSNTNQFSNENLIIDKRNDIHINRKRDQQRFVR